MPDLAPTVSDTVIEVLEQQAFMFADPCSKDNLDPLTDSFLSTSMQFQGPVQGSVAMMMTSQSGLELAANVLGLDMEEPEDEDAEDALKELLNVICGQLLTSMYGTEPVFALSIPVAEVTGVTAWEDFLSRSDTLGLLIDDAPALVAATIKESLS